MEKIFSVIFLWSILVQDVFAQVRIDTSNNPGLAKGSLEEILQNILNFATSFLAELAVLVIVIAGIMYMVSGGNEDRIAHAKRTMTGAIGGLILALLAWVIISTIADTLQAG